MIELKGVHIPGGQYVSKSKAATYLKTPLPTLQYHIQRGHLATIHMPGNGHLIRVEDILKFDANRPKPGRPTIYEKK